MSVGGMETVVSRRQSILSPQMLSPDTLVVMDSNRWNSVTATKTAALTHSQAWTITTRLNLLKQQSFFFSFSCMQAANTIILQAGKTGWRRETQHRLGTYTETNKQVWLVLHWGLKGKRPSGGKRMVQCSFYTRLTLQLLTRGMFWSD